MRVFELAAVKCPDAGNLACQSAHPLCGFFVVAADNNVAINWAISEQHLRGSIVKGGHHRDPIRHEFCRLLRCRALPYAESTSGASADTGRQWNGCVHQNLAGPERRLEMLQSLRLNLERNSQDNNVCRLACACVFATRNCTGEAARV